MMNSNGQSVGVGRIVEFNGKKGYMLYNASLDVTFNGEDGSTLALDGYSTATYVKGDTVVSGYYNVKSSAFGGSIITFVSNNVTYTFLTKSHTEETVTPGENGEDKIEKITVYTFEVKPNGYAEYYYKDASGTYYAPLVVINDKEEGKANVYGYTKNKTYELVLEGTYTYDENTKLYAFVATSSDDTVEVINNPIEISKVTSFIFNIDTTTTSYAINYWYQSVIGDETKTYDVKYTSDNATMSKSIGKSAFYGGWNIQEVTFGSKLVSIGDYAFNQCHRIPSITFTEKVEEIGVKCFYKCRSLTSVVFNDLIKSIPEGAFNGCRDLEEINIPDTIERIGKSAFYKCENVSKLTLGKNVNYIGDYALG